MYVILGLLLFNDLLWVLDCFHNAYLLFDFYLLYSVDEWGDNTGYDKCQK